MTKLLVLQKEDWLLLCNFFLSQYGYCTQASFLNLRQSAALCCPLLDSMNPTPLNRVWEDELLWKFNTLNLYTSLKALDFSEQLVFSSLEIPDAC